MINRIMFENFISEKKETLNKEVFKIEYLVKDLDVDGLDDCRRYYKNQMRNLTDVKYPVTMDEYDVRLHTKLFNEEKYVYERLVRYVTYYIRMIGVSHKRPSEFFKSGDLFDIVREYERNCIKQFNYYSRSIGHRKNDN